MVSGLSRARALMAALVLVLAGVGLAPSPAAAEEVYAFPTSVTSVSFSGHGWGHGIGMSQWGAEGAATQGLGWPAILGFYYPGATAAATLGNPTVRVSLSAVGTSALLATAEAGVYVTVAGTAYLLPARTATGATITRFGLWPTSTAMVLRAESSGAWADFPLPGRTASVTSPATFSNPTRGVVFTTVSGSARGYRGTLTAYRTSSTTLSIVNTTSVDSYLRGVVPSEVPSSWHPAALAAQAVAARTYTARRLRNPGSTYDICDSTMCQVYSGVGVETTATSAAVTSTSGVILTSGGAPIDALYSSSNGGWTVAGGTSYLVAKPDPYDAVPGSRHSWQLTVSRSTLEGRYPTIGSLRTIRVLSRDGHGEWGGRVLTMALDGTLGSVTTSGASFAAAVGLYHHWFVPLSPGAGAAWPRDFTGDGRADVLGVTATGTLRVYPGTGAGGFAVPGAVSGFAGGFDAVVTAGPLTPDAVPDLIGRRADGTLWLLRGAGFTAVEAPVQIGHGWSGFTALLGPGDWDGDGPNDLIARSGDGRLWLYPGTGSGRLGNGRVIGTGWGGMLRILGTGDADGDGHVDLAAVTTGGTLLLYPGTGSGGFKAARAVGTGWQYFTALICMGDFTGDKRPDLIARRSDGALILYAGYADGSWHDPRQIGVGWNALNPILP